MEAAATARAGRATRPSGARRHAAGPLRVGEHDARPKTPLAELVSLTVDGDEVSPLLQTRPRRNGAGLEDHYHAWTMPDAAPGRHTATATVRSIETNARVRRTIEFEV